jgi:hypothetical protein
VGALALANPGLAQAAASVPSKTEVEAKAEAQAALVLSPFTVSEDATTGYLATSTLAGTRINTSVKDVGASISVYTKDLLTDLGANNASELLIYATGMEAAGAQGNYSGATNDLNASQINGEGPRNDSQRSRTRGLASPNFTRGLFPTNIAIDAYNTGTVTVNRGPNATLFGVGSPAGVVDNALTQANLDRNSNRVEFRFGNNNATRSVVDFNRVLVPKRLAVRFSALAEGERYNQRPAFSDEKRLYGTITLKPFKSTSVRSSFETGNTKANRPITVLPFNSVGDEWFAAGMPLHDWTFYDDPARNPNAAAQNPNGFYHLTYGQAQIFDQLLIAYSSPAASAPSAAYRATVPNTPGTVLNSLRNTLFHPLVNRDQAADAILTLTTRNIAEIPAAYFPGGQVPAGIKMQGFTDFNAFDFKNRLLDESSRQGSSFRVFNVALEQLAWSNRLGLEIAYNHERVDNRTVNSFLSANNANHLRVDVNTFLPTGQRNPNVGRPYAAYGQSNWSNTFTEFETVRATAFARYNFKDLGRPAGKWLGRHVLTGLFERHTSDRVGYSHRLTTEGAAANAIATDPNVFARRPALWVYIGDSVLSTGRLDLQPIRIPALSAGPSAPATWFSAPAGSAAQGDFVTSPSSLREINTSGTGSREVIESYAAVLQSFWAGEHIVTTLGWRRDRDFSKTESFSYATNPDKVHYGLGDFEFPTTPPPAAEADVKSYSVVGRWPQKLLRLPWGMDLSAFFNRSANFTPLGNRVDILGNKLASPQGKTEEIGLNVSFLNDRFNLRVNRFETSVTGQSFASPAYVSAYNNGVLQSTGFWAQERNINPGIDRTAEVELVYSVLPPNFRELQQWRISGTPEQANLAPQHTVIPGVADTTDYVATGTEFELAFTPNRQWRILANVARQETVQSNVAPNTKAFLALLQPVWSKMRDIPRGNYPAGQVPGTPAPASALTYGQWLDTNVYTPFANTLATEGSASAEQRKWRANLIVNYTFSREGRLRGWSTGAGVRWQDKIGIGYPANRDAAGLVTFDFKHPYFYDPETNIDCWVAYTRKIWRNRIDWRVQLNIRNLVGQEGPIPITVQPWGDVATSRLAPERRWYLANTFSF